MTDGQDQKRKRLRTGGTARLLLLQMMLSSALLYTKQAYPGRQAEPGPSLED